MTDEDRAALEAERVDLQRKVKKRRDMPGMAANVAAVDARIAEIEAALNPPAEPPAD